MLDLFLAIVHHILIFSLFGVLLAELMMVRRGMDSIAITRVKAIDFWYGVLAGLIIAVGFSRAIFATKGWSYYSHNAFFWAKIGTFMVMAVISVLPTRMFLKWEQTIGLPALETVDAVRRYLWLQMALFPLLLVFAAAMARGYGTF